MGYLQPRLSILCYVLFGIFVFYQSFVVGADVNQAAYLIVNASESSGWHAPETLFGLFFEEINHAGAGGLWAELVSNRGFEAGGPNTPSNIDPWSIIGDESSIIVSTDRSSCFDRNKIALRMEVLCGTAGSTCPAGGVGIYNPGYWGMNIEQGKNYKVVLHVRSLESVDISVSLASLNGSKILATANVIGAASDFSNWTKVEVLLEAKETDHNSRLQLTTTSKGVMWFDQVSAMPLDTYKGHGFRKELAEMLASLKPGFIRFPGGSIEYELPVPASRKYGFSSASFRAEIYESWFFFLTPSILCTCNFPFLAFMINVQKFCPKAFKAYILKQSVSFDRCDWANAGGSYVEGEWLRNAFRWKETIGPWEERPGHFGDVWMYWTDDGLGYFEFLQLAEDLGASPVWVFNNGISHNDQVASSTVLPFIQEILDSIQFARGDPDSTWGYVRAAMGHPEPFDLRYVALGNQDCGKNNYRGNYLKFYYAIKNAYPDIKIISNCDGSSHLLDHPADLYDFHVYTSASNMFSMAHKFDSTSRNGPKAFVSEYAVTGNDAGTGNFLAALAEAGFLIGLERNSDVVEMASSAPLFVNDNDRRWNPDAIVFNSWQEYGTPSYWVQQFFSESSGATVLNTNLQGNSLTSLVASAITWKNSEDNSNYLRIKIVNFESNSVSLKISVEGLPPNSVDLTRSKKTIFTYNDLKGENSFKEPNKVVPVESLFTEAGKDMDVVLPPHSLTSFDLLRKSNNLNIMEVIKDLMYASPV